ncbi:deoxyuridine 5'-triphosphate nucleotidohydrolase [Corynebacterium argentoratense DSM 44202]|uniref:dUTP diphosphatase n=1 Tax=Corynebacterium argentoratense DSM 44202 TaxID=1348662 RepID=U3GS18_9CORY|nr:dUTP diphosphatase [Corynebacterium argentoratense]AGU14185.1 deoxyuridine 5'-triphosphate nucleotidohydrolase [Corynebacterium argentoratense DSM 44202]
MSTPIAYTGHAPVKAHATDAGYDLVATAAKTLAPGQRALIPTGLHINLPAGTVGYVCPRSGLAAKHGITVLNAPGVIDPGYIGEIFVNLINLDECPYVILEGDRIAQLIIHNTVDVDWQRVSEFEETQRGDNGHGSTGA